MQYNRPIELKTSNWVLLALNLYVWLSFGSFMWPNSIFSTAFALFFQVMFIAAPAFMLYVLWNIRKKARTTKEQSREAELAVLKEAHTIAKKKKTSARAGKA